MENRSLSSSTICAVSTAPGVGGIAVVRVSGPEAFPIADKVFRAARKGVSLSSSAPNSVVYGNVVEAGGLVLDSVLVSCFFSPHSFTGEDTVEISCHGSAYIQQRLLQLLLSCGCQMAQPGEFTKRAFLNGKMDLSQAEAVADVIASSSASAHRMALNQLRGGFSHELDSLRDSLLHFLSMIELELDFSTEDVEFASRPELLNTVDQILSRVSRLRDSFSLGNATRNGVPVAIVGPSNAGKSTLLNAVLNEERAIVSSQMGTTRDVVSDSFVHGGVLFRIVDTAGIRPTNDEVEEMGIRRSFAEMQKASVVLVVVDASLGPDAAAAFVSSSVVPHLASTAGHRVLLVFNKCDVVDQFQRQALESLPLPPGFDRLFISAQKKLNLDSLFSYLLSCASLGSLSEADVVVSNARHYDALCRAACSLVRVRQSLIDGLPEDLLSRDLNDCVDALGEITGRITSDDVLKNIFSKFCIGK